MDIENKLISDLLKKICIPALLIIGTFGNIVSILIFNKKSLKEYSTFQYLSLICVIDLCVLYTGCSQIILEVNIFLFILCTKKEFLNHSVNF
jgi:hypothetical protein